MTNNSYRNWKEFISVILTEGNQFTLENSFTKNETDIEVYRQQVGDEDTILEVGYLKDDRLIYLNIHNDNTPGLNKYQNEYYNEHDFSESESYGNPGLLFSETNRMGILDELRTGLIGKEKVYFSNGVMAFSELTIVLDKEQNLSFKNTYNFESLSIFQRLKRLIKAQQNDYKTKEIDLKTVFGGLNG